MTIPLVPLQEFVGNEELRKTLTEIRLPAASLFTGPAGVGKKTLAVSLVAHRNCKGKGSSSPCGECPSCRKIQGGNHPDVIVADRSWVKATMKAAKKNYNPRVITIDVARALIREAQYQPFEAAERYFIVDEVDKLNPSASNALLKTLEEPPAESRFVLVTAHPEKLLPTILSRCQRFNFRGLERDQIEEHLRSHELDSAEERAAFAQGSIGRAIDLDLERLLSDRDLMLQVLSRWCRSQSFGQIFSVCNQKPLSVDLKDRERALELFQALAGLGEDLYFLATEQPHRVINRDRQEELEKISGWVDLEWIGTFLYHVMKAVEDVERYITPLVCFEALWLETLREHA